MPVESLNLHDKKSNDDFKATPEEMKMIADKMKDPEFMKLFSEYATSLADPQYRKEEEEYLKQVEKEAREGGDHSFDFVFPKPAFAIELLQKDNQCKGKKAFLNICTSDKIDVYEERTTGDRNGSHWHVPVSVGNMHQEDPGDGKLVDVWDAVFHPKTVAISDRSDRFMVFLIEIAVENLNAGYNRQFGFEFKRLPSSTPCIGQPKNQTIKKKAGESAFPKDTTGGVSLGPMKATKAGSSSSTASAATQPPPAAPSRSSTSSGSAASAPPPPLASTPPAAPAKKKDNLPKHTIAHKGEIDLTDAWNWKTSDKRIGIPKELVVKMQFEGVKTAKVLEINVEPVYISVEKNLEGDHKYFGTIPLPFTVEQVPASAKFEKNKGILTLTLTVVPPPKPKESQIEKEAEELAAKMEESKEASPSPAGTASQAASPSPRKDSEVALKKDEDVSSSPTVAAKHQDPVPAAAAVEAESPKAAAPTATSTAKKDEIFSVEDTLKELEEEEQRMREEERKRRSTSTGVTRAPPASKPKKEESTESSTATKKESTTSSTAAGSSSPPVAAPAKFDHLGDNDRAAKLREALEKARKDREEAERKEEEQKSKENTPASTPQKKKKSDDEVVVADQEKKKESQPDNVEEKKKQVDEPDMVDLTDLMKKQDEWLKGVKATEREEQMRQQMEEEEKEMQRMIEKAEKEAEQEREAKRKAKEQAKKLAAEKEAERLAAALAQKKAELPLGSHHIFALN